MKDASSSMKKFALHRTLRITGAAVCAALLVLVLCHVGPVSAEGPKLAEKKSVVLDKSRTEAEHTFAATCAKCHALPNPVKPSSVKPDCIKDLSAGDLAQVQAYVADVIKGKSLYEARCGRCHGLIAPAAHTREYWSKNVCTSEACFIENLKSEEEQQVLLYLSSQAKKN